MPRLIIVGLLLLLTSGYVSAQQPHAPGCASAEAEQLNFLKGEWKVKSRFRLSKVPEQWEETEVRSSISYLFQKCLLVERLLGTRQGHPFKATAMYGYDRTTKKYELVSADSEHGSLTLYAGSLNGNELVLDSGIEIAGQSILLRRLIKKNSAGGFEIQSQRSTDQGRTWETPWHLIYFRK